MKNKEEILKEFKDKFEDGISHKEETLSCLGNYYFYDKIEEFISKSIDKVKSQIKEELMQIVIEDVPHQYQERLLNKLKK